MRKHEFSESFDVIATVRAAHNAGVNLFDMAPLYGNGEAETVMVLAFASGYPEDVRVTTNCMLGNVMAAERQKLAQHRLYLFGC